MFFYYLTILQKVTILQIKKLVAQYRNIKKKYNYALFHIINYK